MFRLTRPGVADIRQYLDAQHDAPWSYAAVGATQTDQPPLGYDWDRTRVPLGHGASIFARAKAAVERWAMFPRPLARLYWPDAPIEVGTVVAVLFRGGPLWSLNAARIVYVVDESSGEATRFGFAYGTLADHAEEGEERFLVEWRRDDDSVWYDLAAFSRPRHVLARLAYPYVRRSQAKFRRLSGLAMQRAVQSTAKELTADERGFTRMGIERAW